MIYTVKDFEDILQDIQDRERDFEAMLRAEAERQKEWSDWLNNIRALKQGEAR